MSSGLMPMEKMKEQELQKEKLKCDTVKTMTPVDLTECSQAGVSLPALRQRELSTATYYWTPYLGRDLNLDIQIPVGFQLPVFPAPGKISTSVLKKGGFVAYH